MARLHARAVVRAIGCDAVSVVRALGLANPRPTLRPDHDIERAIQALPEHRDPYPAGQHAVNQWLLTGAGPTPGSAMPRTGRRPTRTRPPPSST